MKRSRLLRRLMTLSMVSEVLYMMFITVLLIFRPAFYDNALVSFFTSDGIKDIPVNNPDMTLSVVLFGGVMAFFIIWFLLKLSMDKDMDPSIMGIITFLMLPASSIVYRLMYRNILNGLDQGKDALAFMKLHFRVMEYCNWVNLAAYIFLLMAYAVCKQRFSDLD